MIRRRKLSEKLLLKMTQNKIECYLNVKLIIPSINLNLFQRIGKVMEKVMLFSFSHIFISKLKSILCLKMSSSTRSFRKNYFN